MRLRPAASGVTGLSAGPGEFTTAGGAHRSAPSDRAESSRNSSRTTVQEGSTASIFSASAPRPPGEPVRPGLPREGRTRSAAAVHVSDSLAASASITVSRSVSAGAIGVTASQSTSSMAQSGRSRRRAGRSAAAGIWRPSCMCQREWRRREDCGVRRAGDRVDDVALVTEVAVRHTSGAYAESQGERSSFDLESTSWICGDSGFDQSPDRPLNPPLSPNPPQKVKIIRTGERIGPDDADGVVGFRPAAPDSTRQRRTAPPVPSSVRTAPPLASLRPSVPQDSRHREIVYAGLGWDLTS